MPAYIGKGGKGSGGKNCKKNGKNYNAHNNNSNVRKTTALTACYIAAATFRGGVLDRRDVLDVMRGCSRMTIDPRIPTTPGRGGGVQQLISKAAPQVARTNETKQSAIHAPSADATRHTDAP